MRLAALAAAAASLLLATPARSEQPEPEDTSPAVTEDPKTWTEEIRAVVDLIRTLPASSKNDIKAEIFGLAAKGRLARPAIAAIASQSDLPEPQRAFGGILLTHFARFDATELRRLVGCENPFAQREAIALIGKLGGKENAEFLAGIAAKTESAGLKKHIETTRASMPAESLPARALALLDRVMNAGAEKKKWAAAILAEDFGKDAAPSLLLLIKDIVADDDAKTYASAALVRIENTIAELTALCARDNPKVLRYCALRALADQGEEGTAVLRKLAADETEPLRKQINELLGGKDK